MRPGSAALLALFLATSLGGPLLLALAGALRGRSVAAARVAGPRGWDWRLTVASTLLYVFAFSVVFMVQEVFLVWPKALTPGLHPVLFHNNHTWTGDNPLASLFQGTGALAILCLGLAALAWSVQTKVRSTIWRLLGVWIAYNGLFQSLPQLVAGALLPGNDVGMAMDYLHLSAGERLCAALAGLIALPLSGWALTRVMARLAAADMAATPGRAAVFTWRAATLPLMAALPLIFAFRLPGGWDQVYLVPVVVSLLGGLWMQAWAFWPLSQSGEGQDDLQRPSLRPAAAAVVLLLALFQLVLRRGIPF